MKHMQAALYSLRIKRPGVTGGFSDKEFISCGSTEEEIAKAAENVCKHYETASGEACLLGPFPIASEIFGELDTYTIDWEELKRQVDDKKGRIPKEEGGCIFRGGFLPTDQDSAGVAEMEELKDSIVHFMGEHRQTYYGEEFIFIGAIYDEAIRRIAGGAMVIKANNLEHAADICQLKHFDAGPFAVFVSWCCHIVLR